jgi:hypothetical protein
MPGDYSLLLRKLLDNLYWAPICALLTKLYALRVQLGLLDD